MPRFYLAALSFLAVALCAPWASASIYPQCEVAPIMSVPDDLDAFASESSDVEAHELEDGADCDGLVIEHSGQVPVCLLEGASAVAERPIHDTDGTAVEAGDGTCFEVQAADSVLTPSEEMPVDPPQAGPHAVVPATPEVPRPVLPLLSNMTRPNAVVIPTGHTPGVFRPPRP